jgi:geranylgeranyl diphosphate synthase, type II
MLSTKVDTLIQPGIYSTAPSAAMPFDFDAWAAERISQVNSALSDVCNTPNRRLTEAMRYSLLAGGKRIRPLLCLAACEAMGGDSSQIVHAACSVELIHTFSLIDDLPAMDDDDLRRGLPTCHKKYDEATAILAGDALQAMAFRVLLTFGKEPAATALHELADTCIIICAGQAADLQAEGQPLSLEELKRIHLQKTGALLASCVRIGGILGRATVEQQCALTHYGFRIGVAFQIVDDILDVTETSETLGKPANSDLKHDKATYPKLVGLDESRRLAHAALAEALEALSCFDERAEPLRELARRIVVRNT